MATDPQKQDDPRTVQLKMVRLSFTDSLKDKKATVEDDPNAVPKYSVNLILEKVARDGDPHSAEAVKHFEENDRKIRAAIAAACEQEWKNPDKWKQIADDDPKRICYRKGERFKNKESGEVYQGYAGNWAISGGCPAKGQKRPKMWDRRKRPFRGNAKPKDIDAGRFFTEDEILDVMYGGSFCDAIVSFYGTPKGGNGVFCTVEAIRSREEGDRMGGGGWQGDESAFDNLDDDDSFGGSDDPLG